VIQIFMTCDMDRWKSFDVSNGHFAYSDILQMSTHPALGISEDEFAGLYDSAGLSWAISTSADNHPESHFLHRLEARAQGPRTPAIQELPAQRGER
jgi:hypothetical protein